MIDNIQNVGVHHSPLQNQSQQTKTPSEQTANSLADVFQKAHANVDELTPFTSLFDGNNADSEQLLAALRSIVEHLLNSLGGSINAQSDTIDSASVQPFTSMLLQIANGSGVSFDTGTDIKIYDNTYENMDDLDDPDAAADLPTFG